VKTENPSVKLQELADQEVTRTQSGPKVNLIVSVSAKLSRDLFFFSFVNASIFCVSC
jgi:hypothetical protein